MKAAETQPTRESDCTRHARPPIATRTVERASFITVEEFESHIRPGGRPVVIDGWAANWRALDLWDLDFFKVRYGSDTIRIKVDADVGLVEASMREYIEYIQSRPPGATLTQLAEGRDRGDDPFYCVSYKPFSRHPELRGDFHLPPFLSDWWPFFNADFKGRHFPQNQGWILIGAERSSASLHRDSHHTITWLAQMYGRKEYRLFDVADSHSLYDGLFDPLNMDLDRFPRLTETTMYTCVLEPGQMLFLPPDWWHHSFALDESITVSYNFVNHLNFGLYLQSAYGSRLPELLASLPGQVTSGSTTL